MKDKERKNPQQDEAVDRPTMLQNHPSFDDEAVEETLDNGVVDDRPFKCQYCSKEFRQKGHLVYHLHTHSEICDFKCDECEEKFMTPAKMLRHQRSAHAKVGHAVDLNSEFFVEQKGARKTYTCKRCGKYFSHMSSARSHSWMHSGTKPFKCNYCHKDFRQSGHLICHFREFHLANSEDRICKLCPKEFRSRKTYELHMIEQHSQYTGQEKDGENNGVLDNEGTELNGSVPNERPMTNGKDHREGDAVSSAEILSVPQGTTYQIEQNELLSPDNSNEMEFVSRTRSEIDLEEANVGASVSSEMDRKSSRDDDPEEHSIDPEEHSNETMYFIPGDDFEDSEPAISMLKNGLSFSYSPSLMAEKKHISVKVIGNKRRFDCTLCNKVFYRAQTAKNHSLIHAGIKPFRCNVCNQRFRQRAHVVCHMHRHTEAKYFGCKYCDKTYSSAKKLKQHAKEVHNLAKTSLRSMTAPHVKFLQRVDGANEKEINRRQFENIDPNNEIQLPTERKSSRKNTNGTSSLTRADKYTRASCNSDGVAAQCRKTVSAVSRSPRHDSRDICIPACTVKVIDCMERVDHLNNNETIEEISEVHSSAIEKSQCTDTMTSEAVETGGKLFHEDSRSLKLCSAGDEEGRSHLEVDDTRTLHQQHPTISASKKSKEFHQKSKQKSKQKSHEEFVCKQCCKELSEWDSDEINCILCGKSIEKRARVRTYLHVF